MSNPNTSSADTSSSSLSHASLSSLSRNQVDDLLETLTAPLQGRQLLLPLTNVAFVHGALQPEIQHGNEMVHVVHQRQLPSSSSKTLSTNGATQSPPNGSAHVTLAQARDWLTQFSSTALPKPKPNSAMSQKPKFTTTSTSTTVPTKKAPSSHPTTPAPSFVDIREEYDHNGNPLAANVVDMNKQLEALLNLDLGESKESNWMDMVLEERPDSSVSWVEESDQEPRKSLTDQEYQKISQRLEELARLEEEETQQKQRGTGGYTKRTRNAAASKSGWNKGFLNTDNKKAPKKAPPPPKTTPKPNPAAVKFDTSQNQTQEIPRIGTQKVPAKTVPIRPLEETAFSGIVQERPAIMERVPISKVVSNPAPKQQQSTTTDSAPKPKRMSRFAQERKGL